MKKALLGIIILIFSFSIVSFAKVVKMYYPNGNLKYVVRYDSKNVLNGPYKYYWPTGQLKELGRYKNGQNVGPVKKYSLDGELLGQPSNDGLPLVQ